LITTPQGALARLKSIKSIDIDKLKQAGVKISDIKAWKRLYEAPAIRHVPLGHVES
jgi:hypothetical protein